MPHDQIIDPLTVEDIAEIPSEPIQVDKVEPSVHDFVVPPVDTKKVPPMVPPTYLRITCLVYHLNQHIKVQINLPFKLES